MITTLILFAIFATLLTFAWVEFVTIPNWSAKIREKLRNKK